jgi:hypothetical protein
MIDGFSVIAVVFAAAASSAAKTVVKDIYDKVMHKRQGDVSALRVVLPSGEEVKLDQLTKDNVTTILASIPKSESELDSHKTRM